jgi:hypothetical protein
MRLTKSEVEKIKQGESVIETVDFSNQVKLAYCLEPSNQITDLEARFENQNIRVLGPMKKLIEWAASNEVSLKTNPENENTESLFILIEKDFFCLKPRVHEVEDESDLFANPNEAHGSCG